MLIFSKKTLKKNVPSATAFGLSSFFLACIFFPCSPSISPLLVQERRVERWRVIQLARYIGRYLALIGLYLWLKLIRPVELKCSFQNSCTCQTCQSLWLTLRAEGTHLCTGSWWHSVTLFAAQPKECVPAPLQMQNRLVSKQAVYSFDLHLSPVYVEF